MDDHDVGRAGVGLVVGWGDPAVTGAASAGGFVLPTGMVAFLLTDVAASTQRWEAEPDAMAAAMERHDAILDLAVSAHGGVRPLAQGEGDSIVAAFSRASDAVLAAAEAQRGLTAELWPTSTPLLVRMAVHAGEARTATDGNYAGQAIIRTARLRAITHGGQILVSEPARDLVVDHLGDKVTLVDLGEHRLRDLARPERVFQVTGPGLPDDFAPLESLDALRHNLPIQLSSFVGRVDDIATVADLIRANRLVTIVGGGGSGKTRLALQVAAEVADQSEDGTWWVELAEVRDSDLAVATVASAIGVRSEIGAGAADALSRVLAELDMLLVLDNCEHLVEVVADAVGTLLRGCPHVSVLATSREPLELPGEIAWRIPPMTCPAADAALLAVGALSQFDSVRLFLDRAQQVRPGFTVDDSNAPAIAAICSRLDGVPLAIELAAARCRSMSPAQIFDGLTDVFRLLTGSSRGVLPRQATLEASITWSHDLLSAPERVLFRRLPVFAGGCTLDAAEAVCSDDDLVPVLSVLDLLDRLVSQSLVILDARCEPPRYRLLDTVRQYGTRQLDESGEAETIRDRHLDFYLEGFGAIGPSFEALAASADPAVVRSILWERDNLLLGLDHAAARGRWEDYAGLVSGCGFWLGTERPDEVLALFERIPETQPLGRALRAELAFHRAQLLFPGGDQRSFAALQEALTLSADGVHPYLFAYATQTMVGTASLASPALAESFLDGAAIVARDSGDPLIELTHAVSGLILRVVQGGGELARPYVEQVERLRGLVPNSPLVPHADNWSSVDATDHGDLVSAARYLDRAEEWWAERDWRRAGRVTWVASHFDAARAVLAAFRGSRPPADPLVVSCDLARRQRLTFTALLFGNAAGLAQLVSGDLTSAWKTFAEAQASAAAIGHLPLTARNAAWCGRAALALGDLVEARARLAVADEVSTTHGLRSPEAAAAEVLRSEIALVEQNPGASSIAQSALEYVATCGFRLHQIDVLEVLAVLAGESRDHREVARLQGAIARARDDVGYGMRMPGIAERVDAAIGAAIDALGQQEFNIAFEDGRRLSLEEVTAYALRFRGARKRPSTGWASLTPTELAVVEQVRLGLTNPQIAERLLMSRDTVKTHLSHIYTKLGVANRTELALVAPESSPPPR